MINNKRGNTSLQNAGKSGLNKEKKYELSTDINARMNEKGNIKRK
jgi:hypothetical protein